MVGHRLFHRLASMPGRRSCSHQEQWVIGEAAVTAPCRFCLGLLHPGEWETANFPGNFRTNFIKIPRKAEVFQGPCSWPKLLSVIFVPCELSRAGRRRVCLSLPCLGGSGEVQEHRAGLQCWDTTAEGPRGPGCVGECEIRGSFCIK